MDDQDAREIRATRNQALFRAINERISEMNDAFEAFVGSFSVACECADMQCVTLLTISPDVYHEVRKNPRRFVVLTDHVYPDVEEVVSSHNGYTVVEAIGRGAEVAEAEAAFLAEDSSTGEDVRSHG